MAKFTMTQLLAQAGHGSHATDPQLTRKIAAELRAKGFIQVRQRLADGKNGVMWTNEEETKAADREEITKDVLAVLPRMT